MKSLIGIEEPKTIDNRLSATLLKDDLIMPTLVTIGLAVLEEKSKM
jgi:hypothetical protein